MRIALLGADSLSPLIARAIVNTPDWSLASVCEAGEQASVLRPICPTASWDDPWEALLARGPVEAVIFTAGSDPNRSSDQLRRLAQAGVPLLVMHPACDLMTAYELEVIRRESGAVLVPFAADWWHPAWTRLREWSPSAEIEQVRCDRYLPDRSAPAVLAQFSRDEWHVRYLLRQVASVQAAGAVLDDTSFGNLSIHCAGPGRAAAHWAVAPASGDPVSRWSITRAGGTARLEMPAASHDWTLHLPGPDVSEERFRAWDAGRAALETLRRAVQGQALRPDWSDVCLSLETVDSVRQSLRRKRAIDVHAGAPSEENAFKGYMSAAGCLILATVLIGFLGLAVFEGFRLPLRDSLPSAAPSGKAARDIGVFRVPPRDGAPAAEAGSDRAGGWPLWAKLWPVYPLLAFLLLQFLLVLTRRRPDSGRGPPSTAPP